MNTITELIAVEADHEALRRLIAEAERQDGLPVALVCDEGEVKIGVMNFIPDADDWFTNPVALEVWIDKNDEQP